MNHQMSRRDLVATSIGAGLGMTMLNRTAFAQRGGGSTNSDEQVEGSGSLLIEEALSDENARSLRNGEVQGIFHVFRDPHATRRRLDLRVSGVRANVVSAFFCEEKNGEPHFGAAEFLTLGCMYNGNTVRVIGYLDDSVSYHGGLMIVAVS